jgi:uncharacterized protein YjiS (DUF1127 family)
MAMITETSSGAQYSASLSSSMMAATQAIAGMLRFRKTLNALDRLDDRQLRDIGLTRSDLVDLRMASSTDAVNAIGRVRFYR